MPQHAQVLHVEQEVVGDDTPVLQVGPGHLRASAFSPAVNTPALPCLGYLCLRSSSTCIRPGGLAVYAVAAVKGTEAGNGVHSGTDSTSQAGARGALEARMYRRC